MRKEILFKLGSPVLLPITRLVIRSHYQDSKQLTEIPHGQKILVLAPHMDDETIGLGGTIRRHAESGAQIDCLFITDGASSVSSLDEKELSSIRKSEIDQVKNILGITRVDYLDIPDGRVASHQQTADQLAAKITLLQPDVIYCTTFVDAHPDHVATANFLAAALARTEDISPVIRLYEINCPFPPNEVNCIVDISETMAAKQRAIEIFKSQAIAFDGFLELNRLKANLTKGQVKAAEVFLQLSKQTFIELTKAAASRNLNYSKLFKQANRSATLLWAIYKNHHVKKRIYEESWQ
ncbi:PIG-L deacetylase family protein [Sediminibacillus albus]|uniref:N-acetylglucosaminyl deacetylase, LmbE family n=1 Tax=Sediminibacillus albus TaxID=407036 RepID=A0A1G8ZH68_9BACI|nr:PIG-L family deacetylase [Sediminibacillus albus]SDK14387.1 N-acetylglucosaminyl deacetylase, LmbE family [Sediminibacillus albus]